MREGLQVRLGIRGGDGAFEATVRSAVLIGLAAAATACTGFAPPRTAVPSDLYEDAGPASVASARFWGDTSTPPQRAKARATYLKAVSDKWEAAGRPEEGVEMNFLALSGGGPDGAFAAGLLSGWSVSGTRPRFDLVSGISVGALIAPFVFAGPEHDATLRAMFTEFRTENIAIMQPISALFGSLGIADTTPLRRTLSRFVDEEFLRQVAEVDLSGRSLLIGTTNIDAGRPVIWDMGRIARAGNVELFRDVMMASAAMPGIFPPVEIEVEAGGERYSEFHVDGGVTHSVVALPRGYEQVVSADLEFPVRQTFYVIQNNALEPPYSPVDSWLPSIAARSLSTLIRGQTAGDLLTVYYEAETSNSAFRMIYVPSEFQAASAADFDQEYMRGLFTAAYEDALDGITWHNRPPGIIAPAEDE
jgi:predicted acylesterase/phospholipase RssA